VQFIDCAQSFGVVATKAVGAFNNDVREFSGAGIGQKSLIAFAIWCFTGQHVYILTNQWHVRPL